MRLRLSSGIAVSFLILVGLPISGKAETLKVLSYNIRYLNQSDGNDVWPNRCDTVCSVINSADLVGLQEVVVAQLDDIRNQTPDFEWYGVGRDDGADKGEMAAIGYRKSTFHPVTQGTFWLSDEPSTVGSRSWDAALPRVATWMRLEVGATKTQVLFLNTHFDHRGEQARLNSAKQLRRWLFDNRNESVAVLTGDLNCLKSDAPLVALLDTTVADTPPLHDTRDFPEITDRGPDSTWNGFQDIESGRRIDHILYQGTLQVLDFETLDPRTSTDRFASDHLPIIATIKL